MYRFRDFVMTRRGDAAHVIRSVGMAGHEEYLIMLANGTAQIVRAESLRPAGEVYSTGFGRLFWDGRERRGTERRASERRHSLAAKGQVPNPERRQAERRQDDRRWVVLSSVVSDRSST